jgi:hypothetical protein
MSSGYCFPGLLRIVASRGLSERRFAVGSGTFRQGGAVGKGIHTLAVDDPRLCAHALLWRVNQY